jgi:hypothetical protein
VLSSGQSGLYLWSPQRKKNPRAKAAKTPEVRLARVLLRCGRSRPDWAHCACSHGYQEAGDLGETSFLRNHRTAVESLMQKYGEQMLKVRLSLSLSPHQLPTSVATECLMTGLPRPQLHVFEQHGLGRAHRAGGPGQPVGGPAQHGTGRHLCLLLAPFH